MTDCSADLLVGNPVVKRGVNFVMGAKFANLPRVGANVQMAVKPGSITTDYRKLRLIFIDDAKPSINSFLNAGTNLNE